MRVFFSGLCVFSGWTGQNGSTDPVTVILTKTNDGSKHMPLIAAPSHAVLDVVDTTTKKPIVGDLGFMGPRQVEFVAWNLPRRLTLPVGQSGGIVFGGTEHLIDLQRLCQKSGVTPTLDPYGTQVATSTVITSGSLTARLGASRPQPEWFFNGKNELGKFEDVGVKEQQGPLVSMVIADRVEYAIETEAPEGHVIEFGDVDPTKGNIKLTLRQDADVWVTNLSLEIQFRREIPRRGTRDRLEDVAIHYNLFIDPPTDPDRRYVPILTKSAPLDESTKECTMELCRL